MSEMGYVNLDTWTFHVSRNCARRKGEKEATLAKMTPSDAENNTKAEPCGLCCDGRWGKAKDNLSAIEDNDLDDLTAPEIRLRILGRVGFKGNHETPFSKVELNAIYGYITGDKFFPEEAYRTEKSPRSPFLRREIIAAAGIDLEFDGRAFSRDELIDLCREIESQPDSRHPDT